MNMLLGADRGNKNTKMDKSLDANGHLYKVQSNLAEKFKNYVLTMDSFVLHFFLKKELFPLSYFFLLFVYF